MSELVVRCPECNSVMSFRLGEYECPVCFLTMTKPTEEKKGPKPAPFSLRERYQNIGASLDKSRPKVTRGKRDRDNIKYRIP